MAAAGNARFQGMISGAGSKALQTRNLRADLPAACGADWTAPVVGARS